MKTARINYRLFTFCMSDRTSLERLEVNAMHRWVLVLIGLFALCADAPVSAQPQTVYIHNRQTNPFDNNAEGLIWQRLGLLEPNGRPGTVAPGTNNIVDSNGAKMGEVIRNTAGNIIGCKNLAGNQEAYNVSGGATANQAWLRVAAGGTFDVMKHGGKQLPGGGGAPLFGGGMQVDGGVLYNGFTRSDQPGNGTGGPFGGAYRLDPRPGDGITFNASGCWTSNDPDGAGPQTGVTTSAAAIPGVAAANGHAGQLVTTVTPSLTGTSAQIQAAQTQLKNAAKAAGFVDAAGNGHPGNWIASLALANQYATANAAIAGTGASLGLSYGSGPGGGGGGGGGGRQAAPILVPPDCDHFQYGFNEPGETLGAELLIETGDLYETSLFHLRQLGEIPGSPPADLSLASGVFDFRFLETDPSLADTVDILIEFYLDDPSLLPTPYRFDGSDWLAITGFSIEGDHVAFSTDDLGGAFAVFVPEPASLVLLALGGFLTLRGQRMPPG